MNELLTSTQYREEMVNRYRSLVRNTKPELSKDEQKLLRQAFNLALDESKHRTSFTGDPFIFQPLEISRILATELNLGLTSIISSLLYTYVRDGFIPLEKVQQLFGKNIARIIDSLIKISSIDARDTSMQTENFRKLILSLSTDVRVILIKLAERLNYMRNLDNLPPEQQIKMATESLELYAPLGHRLGLYTLKSELEDLALKYTEPEDYHSIEKKLEASKEKRNRFIRDFIKPIKDELIKHQFKFEIKGRTKSIYSIWRKMRRQDVGFDEVYDKFAIRIIMDSPLDKEKSDCWQVYSIVTDFYQPNPLRLRDWISVPKSNGYESLHTTVVVPGGQWVEVQIRTARMNEIAEKGFAAHWKYKGIESDKGADDWLNKVREVLETAEPDASNFVDDFKLSLYAKEIFVFTPQGDLKKLPAGATVLDFAFDIHSNLGMTCVGAKVNNKNMPIRYPLKNGDNVEIISSKSQKPKEDWLDFVVTSKAKTKIKLALKEELLKEAEVGKEMLRRRLRNWKLSLNDQNVTKILKNYKLKTAVDLYHSIATGKIDVSEIKELILESAAESIKKTEKIETPVLEKIVKPQLPSSEDFLLIDDKTDKLDYQLSKCCNPIFGDPIFGFVTINEGIKIHRTSCPNAREMIAKYGYRVVNARWARTEGDNAFFQATIKVTGIDDVGIVSNISDVISKDLKVNMRSISVDTNDGVFEGVIKVFIHNTNHLQTLIRKLAKVKGVLKVSRLENI
ncbi:MAG: RelA/SpoT family protein [Bacteroidota bacterium]|nr:RelA/SpoT family protein [Bacteroidota bacterium]